MNRFEDCKAIVTGAGSGIGLATAKRFAEEGADVCLIDRVWSEEAAEAMDPGKCHRITCDVSDRHAVTAPLGRDEVNALIAAIDACGLREAPELGYSTSPGRTIFRRRAIARSPPRVAQPLLTGAVKLGRVGRVQRRSGTLQHRVEPLFWILLRALQPIARQRLRHGQQWRAHAADADHLLRRGLVDDGFRALGATVDAQVAFKSDGRNRRGGKQEEEEEEAVESHCHIRMG